MVDPRTSIIDERLKGISHVIAVSSGKGGVGKSLVASTLALILARKNLKTGLLDLDFTSPSTDTILGIGNLYPREEKGVVPPEVHSIRYMSIVYYSGQLPLPLRGEDLTNALVELLAVTKWNTLDYLIIDMPPGTSDISLDILRFVKEVRFLIVTTASQLAFNTVDKLMQLLKQTGTPILGVIENMKMDESAFIRDQVEKRGITFWGSLPFDPQIEEVLGNPDRLLLTCFGKSMTELTERNMASLGC